MNKEDIEKHAAVRNVFFFSSYYHKTIKSFYYYNYNYYYGCFSKKLERTLMNWKLNSTPDF